MMVYNKEISLQSNEGEASYINITNEVREAVKESGVNAGICTVISPHTTCSVFFEEFAHDVNEHGLESLQEDLNNVLRKIIPDHDSKETYVYPGEEHYKAVESWENAADYLPGGDRKMLWNGDAHLKATILGSSESFAVKGGDLGVGKTGYVYFVDFDKTRSRKRTCYIVVMGE